VPLAGVDVSGAFLQGLHLEKANLARANLNAADVRNAVVPAIDLSDADLRRQISVTATAMERPFEEQRWMMQTFQDEFLGGADLSGATLNNADLRGADWARIAKIKGANIAGVKSVPEGFAAWALKDGAVQIPPVRRAVLRLYLSGESPAGRCAKHVRLRSKRECGPHAYQKK